MQADIRVAMANKPLIMGHGYATQPQLVSRPETMHVEAGAAYHMVFEHLLHDVKIRCVGDFHGARITFHQSDAEPGPAQDFDIIRCLFGRYFMCVQQLVEMKPLGCLRPP